MSGARLTRAAANAAVALGMDAIGRRRLGGQLLIVCYHGVVEARQSPHWLHITRRAFAAQLEHLARHFDCRPLDDALTQLAAGALSRPTACVTFDDGYRNNRTVALPELQRVGVPATIYLATGLLGGAGWLWSTRLERMFAAAPRDVDWAAVRGAVLDGPAPDDASATTHAATIAAADATRAALAQAAVEYLKLLPQDERRAREARLHEALHASPDDDFGDYALLSWDEVRAMDAEGLVTFGAHTVHHEIVRRLDDAALAREIGDSVRDVAAHVARPSRTFAYPNGRAQDFDARAERVLRAAGVTAAVSTIGGVNSAATPPFALRRLVVGPALSTAAFRLRAAGLRR